MGSIPPPLSQSTLVRTRVGTLVDGKWQVESVLGSGGMATVYYAVHQHTQHRVAIKVLHQEYCHLDDIRERFAAEARAANRVNHRGAVPVLDDGELDDGTPYLVMDFLDGQSLQQRAEKAEGELSVEEVFSIAERLLEILDAAHAASVLHRDVKPDNVFLTADGEVKLLDFGISKVMGADNTHKTQLGAMMGTPSFMSPEQARGRWDDLDPRADIFAVGATMFAVLAGRAVHQAETLNELLLKVMTEPAPDLGVVAPRVPAFAASVVNRAIAFDKRQRFASALEMRKAVREVNRQFNRALGSISDSEVRSARSSSPALSSDRTTHRPVTVTEWPPALPPAPTNRRRQLAMGALALVALAVLVAIVSLGGGSGDEGASPVAAERAQPPGEAAASAAGDSKPETIDLSDLPEVKKPPAKATSPTPAPAPSAPVLPKPLTEPAPPGDVDPLARRR